MISCRTGHYDYTDRIAEAGFDVSNIVKIKETEPLLTCSGISRYGTAVKV